jgi:septum formation topological specificity factor MinE
VRAEIERLQVLVAARRAAEEEEVRALRAEVARLEAVLKNAGAGY